MTRPATRGDCTGGHRPCPYATCAWHVAQIRPDCRDDATGPVPDVLSWAETCVLDIADRADATLESIGDAMGVSREWIRQIESAGLLHFDDRARRSSLDLGDGSGLSADEFDAAILGWHRTGSDFDQIRILLAWHGRPGWTRSDVESALASAGAFGRVPQALQGAGWLTAYEISDTIGVGAHRVSALLRDDPRVEHVRRPARHRQRVQPSLYRWAGSQS